jgi:hypothetical protein
MQRHHPHRAGNHRADRDDRRHHFGADERRRRPLLRALERNLINTHEPDLRARLIEAIAAMKAVRP